MLVRREGEEEAAEKSVCRSGQGRAEWPDIDRRRGRRHVHRPRTKISFVCASKLFRSLSNRARHLNHNHPTPSRRVCYARLLVAE